ncbi:MULTISPECIES: bifunctional 5,10-methylenetetrahydrofolate dehydrogenase/5,10-methenyltetrahydrofolate cyclohydrolase [unclassified Pseudofrankia]|uniref:bifunctional 5,10-methylenetetrahydrofolate dehydrogenase/5,10-methenyltetrahydrofolate cyclohydrolase n=1 Tax=unclassified Pseudofrankia TaxID=2994372 RepID=UPI0008DA99DF|nr:MULTISPECIES: bifunctional 5,10-methylenetetrahydrofolate dehydrogenase/5,10-methenyltetrahydrofolate cyclohydrolase [unclassified Pseudofrankia]MDT3441578.1 bifunctional 5,10-methylenetetrahydrofolate dehydrogenase/5,10-methenyltetrahydrofolate cyclohydrolase [Pseudofrankia sp. BMG5.37]OHV45527.1 bifunctional 5,10-methylene-tetrahydrofolate dehydrogenase/5,10-methylene-tetrahydrofolate cyclohydrolase [Pseudofrankia sp. BMG5.36]
MRLLDGRAMAAEIGRGVVDEVAHLAETGVTPTLAVVVPGTDPAALSYVRVLERTAGRVGVGFQRHQLTDDPAELAAALDRLAADPAVHGVIAQTPLPAGMITGEVGDRIPPVKDVDGMNPVSLGRLALGLPAFAPATAAAVVEVLRRGEVAMSGARACVIGRGAVVGKPAALLLLAENATVTVCHSRTSGLATVAHEADIVVAAVGRPGLVGAGFVRPGAAVVDVGTTVTDAGLLGDVDADAIAGVAGALTPVPGGVGPVTTMILLRHTVQAAYHATR